MLLIKADICKALIADYGIDSSESTTKRGNMNRFMVFCGLQLSMLANGESTEPGSLMSNFRIPRQTHARQSLIKDEGG